MTCDFCYIYGNLMLAQGVVISTCQNRPSSDILSHLSTQLNQAYLRIIKVFIDFLQIRNPQNFQKSDYRQLGRIIIAEWEIWILSEMLI